VELSESRLVVSGENIEKADLRHVWMSQFKNAKMIEVCFSPPSSNLLIRTSERATG
jgi:hypothetical protein